MIKIQGYTQAQSDHRLFRRFSHCGKIAVLIVYVDDILLTDDHEEIGTMKIRLSKEFEVKDQGEMKYFSAMEKIDQNKGLLCPKGSIYWIC